MRFLFKQVFQLLLFASVAYGIHLYMKDENSMPPLKDGDLIFQTTWVPGAMAIGMSTGSLYLHVGIVKDTQMGAMVIEAANVVRETPIHRWISGGILKRFAVYRYQDLTPEQGKKVVEAAKPYYGKHYDFYYSFDNDTIYCSELVYFAFRDAGVPVGHAQKIGTLNINNRFVKSMIEERWQHYPACEGKDITFEQCYDHIMDGELVSPRSLADDSHVKEIFSNYP